jgi:hypothetical protein
VPTPRRRSSISHTEIAQVICRRRNARKRSARSAGQKPRPRQRNQVPLGLPDRVASSFIAFGHSLVVFFWFIARTEKESKDQPKTKENADADPDGDDMMRVADPLSEARKYLTTLQTYCADRIATHMAACEVFRRLGEPWFPSCISQATVLKGWLCPCRSQRNRCSCSRR